MTVKLLHISIPTMFPRKLKIQLDNEKKVASPFCKVCYDAKQDGFNTHYVRDRPGGEVVCPYLLSLDCAYCGNPGHTVKYCDILQAKSARAPAPAPAPELVVILKKATGGYVQDKDGWNHRPSQAGKFVIIGLDADEKPTPTPTPTPAVVSESNTKNKFAPFSKEIAMEDVLSAKETKFLSEFPSLGCAGAALTQSNAELGGWAAAVKRGTQ